MIIDPRYGPQLDAKDGTLGELKLVKRWVIVYPDLEMKALKQKYPEELADMDLDGPMGLSVWFGKSDNSLKTKKDAEDLIKAFYANNPPGTVPEGLKAVQAWCYPSHLGFACLCE